MSDQVGNQNVGFLTTRLIFRISIVREIPEEPEFTEDMAALTQRLSKAIVFLYPLQTMWTPQWSPDARSSIIDLVNFDR